MNTEQKDALLLLETIVTRAGGVGSGGVVNATRMLKINISTMKRYRKGTLTVPQSRMLSIKMIANLGDTEFQQMLKESQPEPVTGVF